jgi:hypothetical protein
VVITSPAARPAAAAGIVDVAGDRVAAGGRQLHERGAAAVQTAEATRSNPGQPRSP